MVDFPSVSYFFSFGANYAKRFQRRPVHLMENTKLGSQTFRPGRPPTIIGHGSAAGYKESQGPLGRHFDHTCKDDTFGEKSWEMAESQMQQLALDAALKRAGLHTPDLDLLLAKIQALLRRTYEFGGEGRLIQHRGAVLDLDSASLTYGGRRAELTKNEFGILRILMENRGRTVSREDLMSRLWQTDCYVDENTLTVNVARLRRKLEGLGLTDFILTKKGMGYLVE